MRKIIMGVALLMAALHIQAADKNTVVITYNGASATVDIASNIKNYITDNSNGSHVKLVQSENVNANVGEITYILSGSSDDGGFYMEGSYKATVELNGLNLKNGSGPAIDIQNGKRIDVSIKGGTNNTLTDVSGGDWKGCYVCKGHSEFRGRGQLTINSKTGHGIWSKEYVEVKNCTIIIPSAAKDGINCNQYFLMESGYIKIEAPGDDGIQVSFKDTPQTEAEDTGNFTMKDGTLVITGHKGVCIKADGYIAYNGGTQNFNTSDVIEKAYLSGISDTIVEDGEAIYYDLSGRRLPEGAPLPKGITIEKRGNKTVKRIR